MFTKCAVKTLLTYLSPLAIILLFTPAALGQIKNRIIPLRGWTEDSSHRAILELVEIRIAGRRITPNLPFEAGENWLKDMTLLVKNIGKKPIVFLSIGGGLIEGIDEELPPYASYRYGISWGYGKAFEPKKQKPQRIALRPGAIVELSYVNVGQIYRKILAEAGEGAFCKLNFMAPAVQYLDGAIESYSPLRLPGMPEIVPTTIASSAFISSGTSSQSTFLETKLAKLKIGKAGKKEILRLFGTPTSITKYSEWYEHKKGFGEHNEIGIIEMATPLTADRGRNYYRFRGKRVLYEFAYPQLKLRFYLFDNPWQLYSLEIETEEVAVNGLRIGDSLEKTQTNVGNGYPNTSGERNLLWLEYEEIGLKFGFTRDPADHEFPIKLPGSARVQTIEVYDKRICFH
jgi:hypothetical protein